MCDKCDALNEKIAGSLFQNLLGVKLKGNGLAREFVDSLDSRPYSYEEMRALLTKWSVEKLFMVQDSNLPSVSRTVRKTCPNETPESLPMILKVRLAGAIAGLLDAALSEERPSTAQVSAETPETPMSTTTTKRAKA